MRISASHVATYALLPVGISNEAKRLMKLAVMKKIFQVFGRFLDLCVQHHLMQLQLIMHMLRKTTTLFGAELRIN